MANTDTANAKLYATQAQVAAAQAKIYADQSQEASGFSEEAQKAAQDASASAENSESYALAASTSASSSASSASDAAESAADASASAISAAEFGDNKLTFSDTTAGLAGTTTGQYFRVPQGVGSNLSFRYYKNNSGVAQEVAEYPGQGAITNSIREYATLALAQSDVAAGNILSGSYCFVRNVVDTTICDEYVNTSGTLSATGRVIPSKTYVDQRVTFSLSSIRIFPTLTDAQNDVTAGYIANNAYCYVRGTTSGVCAVEYQNVSGTLTLTGKVIPTQSAIDSATSPYVPLLPLTSTSVFYNTGVAGTEYEAVTDQDVVTDSNLNILRRIRNGKQEFLIPTWSPVVTGDALTIAGINIDPAGIPPSIISTNLLGLAQSSAFLLASQFSSGGEYEAITDQDIQLDQDYNYISCIRNGERVYFVPVKANKITVNALTQAGASDLLDSTLFSAGGEYEAWSSYSDLKADGDSNLLEYLKNGEKRFLTPVYTPSLNADVLKLNGVDIKSALGIKTANRIPYTQTVSGKSQVFVFNTDTTAITQVTDGTANETNPDINDAGLLTWTSDRDSTVIAGKFYQNSAGAIYPLISRTVISGWGDSFMEQPVMMNTLYSLTGLTAYNFGKSGLRSTAVAARQGGEPFYCMPVGGVIPASGSVNLTPNQPGPAASASNGAMTGIKCSLGGVDGTFNWSGTQAYFTRDTTGSTVNVPYNLPLFIYPYTTSTVVGSIAANTLYSKHDEAINVITCGRNNTTLVSEVLRNITNIVNYLKPFGKRFVVCPQFTQASETRGTDGYQRIYAINAALKSAFPNNYVEISGVDLLQNFKNHYNPAYAQDVTDIANDTTPTSLRTDNLHPSQVLQSNALYIGAEVNANFIYQFMKLKGWVN